MKFRYTEESILHWFQLENQWSVRDISGSQILVPSEKEPDIRNWKYLSPGAEV